MRMPTADTAKALAILAGTGIVLYLAYKTYKAGAAITEGAKTLVTESLNPASTENIAYKGLNVITGGDAGSSIGSRLYDWFNPTPEAKAKAAAEQAAIDKMNATL